MTDLLPITEDWLREAGWRWHQVFNQTGKQWLLWLGQALVEAGREGRRPWGDTTDLGIELAAALPGATDPHWYCWLRSDFFGRYHRFLHVRHLLYQEEVIALIEALTGAKWDPANNFYGAMHRPEVAARYRQEEARLDRRLVLESHGRSAIEDDATRGRPLPEHVESSEQWREQEERALAERIAAREEKRKARVMEAQDGNRMGLGR